MATSLPVHPVIDHAAWAQVARYPRCADSSLHPGQWFPVSAEPAYARHRDRRLDLLPGTRAVPAAVVAALGHRPARRLGWPGRSRQGARLRRRVPADHSRRRKTACRVIVRPPRCWRSRAQPATAGGGAAAQHHHRIAVTRRCGAIDVHIVTCKATANNVPAAAREPNKRRRTMMQQNTSWPGRVRRAVPWARRQAALRQGRHLRRMGWLVPAAVVAAALIVAGCGSSSPGSGGAASTPRAASGAAASSTALKTATISGATVLTNAKGLTLYSFAPDSMTTSKCNRNCASLWPPVQGPVTAGPRITGKLGTITRSDGSAQATYNGHPLYAYIGDTTPGQANGNGLNSSGGIWHEVTASGAAPAASSGGGGSGY